MDQAEQTEARVQAGVDRLAELGVPADRLEPIRTWLAERWADRIGSMTDEDSSPTVG